MTGTIAPDVSHADEGARIRRVLVARVGAERLAFAVESVAEVLEAPVVAPLPLTPPGVLGQCHWRAQVVPVLDPRLLFGIAPMAVGLGIAAAVSGGGVVLVVTRSSGSFALLVDDVDEVLELRAETMCGVPAGSDRAGRLSALVRTADGLIAVVDMAALLAAADATLQMEVRA